MADNIFTLDAQNKTVEVRGNFTVRPQKGGNGYELAAVDETGKVPVDAQVMPLGERITAITIKSNVTQPVKLPLFGTPDAPYAWQKRKADIYNQQKEPVIIDGSAFLASGAFAVSGTPNEAATRYSFSDKSRYDNGKGAILGMELKTASENALFLNRGVSLTVLNPKDENKPFMTITGADTSKADEVQKSKQSFDAAHKDIKKTVTDAKEALEKAKAAHTPIKPAPTIGVEPLPAEVEKFQKAQDTAKELKAKQAERQTKEKKDLPPREQITLFIAQARTGEIPLQEAVNKISTAVGTINRLNQNKPEFAFNPAKNDNDKTTVAFLTEMQKTFNVRLPAVKPQEMAAALEKAVTAAPAQSLKKVEEAQKKQIEALKEAQKKHPTEGKGPEERGNAYQKAVEAAEKLGIPVPKLSPGKQKSQEAGKRNDSFAELLENAGFKGMGGATLASSEEAGPAALPLAVRKPATPTRQGWEQG